jgi:predicted transposase YbfD/YdcC
MGASDQRINPWAGDCHRWETIARFTGRESGKNAIYMVSAWATQNELVLGQRKVDEKSNEITAIPKLLKMLEISGCIVMIDAIGTQTKITKTILEQGGDYLLAVKENQGNLYEDIHDLFEDDQRYNFEGAPYAYAKSVKKGHGRIEIRQYGAISDPEYLSQIRDRERWQGLKSLVMMISERRIGEESEIQTRYFMNSLEIDAEKKSSKPSAVRGIENRLHWMLDIAFNEDHSRIRKDHAPQNFAILCHMALNLLKQEHTVKVGDQSQALEMRVGRRLSPQSPGWISCDCPTPLVSAL